jgi:hypothetical protein
VELMGENSVRYSEDFMKLSEERFFESLAGWCRDGLVTPKGYFDG